MDKLEESLVSFGLDGGASRFITNMVISERALIAGSFVNRVLYGHEADDIDIFVNVGEDISGILELGRVGSAIPCFSSRKKLQGPTTTYEKWEENGIIGVVNMKCGDVKVQITITVTDPVEIIRNTDLSCCRSYFFGSRTSICYIDETRQMIAYRLHTVDEHREKKYREKGFKIMELPSLELKKPEPITDKIYKCRFYVHEFFKLTSENISPKKSLVRFIIEYR